MVVLACVASMCALGPSASAHRAYVTNQGSASVSVIDTASNAVIGSPIPVGTGPLQVAITPDGSRAYVTNSSGSSVSVIDTQTNATMGAPIPVTFPPFGIAITPDGSRAYVVSQTNPGVVSVIDTQTNTVVGGPITVGANPVGIAITPDGRRAYVTNNTSSTVSVIDIQTNTVVGSPITVGSSPRGIAITPDGTRAYVVNNGGGGSLSVIDINSNTVVGSPIPTGGTVVWIAIARDGSRAYVTASGGTGPVQVVNTQTNTVDGSPIMLGAGSFPQGIALIPSGSRAYVANQGSTTVSSIETASRQVGAPITVGTNPFGVAVAPDQSPKASLSAPGKGLTATLEGGGSSDSDGQIASYDWNFGDGSSAQTTTPTIQHSYRNVGEFTATLTVSDGEGCTGFTFTGQTASCNGPSTASITRTVATVKLGRVKRNKHKGTATLIVNVPGPGELVLSGKGLVKQRPAGASGPARAIAKTVSAAGKVKLKIRSKGKKESKLNRTGKVKVKAKVTYTPPNGDPNTQSRRIKLIKRP